MERSDSEHSRRKSDRLSLIAKIVSDVRFMLPLVLVLFGGSAYNFETVRNAVHGRSAAPLPEVNVAEVASPASESIHPEVRAKIEQIIRVQQQHTRSLGVLNSRIANIEGLVQ